MRKKQQKLSSSQEASQSASCGILKENGGLQLQTLGLSAKPQQIVIESSCANLFMIGPLSPALP